MRLRRVAVVLRDPDGIHHSRAGLHGDLLEEEVRAVLDVENRVAVVVVSEMRRKVTQLANSRITCR